MKRIIRILILTILSPIWVPVGLLIVFFGIGVMIPLYISLTIVGLLEYAFMGDADLLNQIFGKV